MSNIRQTTRTKMMALRLPLDLEAEAVARAHANGYSVTKAITAGLRHAWNISDPRVVTGEVQPRFKRGGK